MQLKLKALLKELLLFWREMVKGQVMFLKIVEGFKVKS
jgi:hypothetical protein